MTKAVSFNLDVKTILLPALESSMISELYYSNSEIEQMKNDAILEEHDVTMDSLNASGHNIFDIKIDLNSPGSKPKNIIELVMASPKGPDNKKSSKALEHAIRNMKETSDKPQPRVRERRPAGGRQAASRSPATRQPQRARRNPGADGSLGPCPRWP